MAEQYNPFAEFQTPEWQQIDPWQRLQRFSQVFPNDPEYMKLPIQEREKVRNKIIGSQDTSELFQTVIGGLQQQGADPVTVQQAFNALVQDDAAYHQLPLEEKQRVRQMTVGVMPSHGTASPRGALGQGVSPHMGQVPTKEETVGGLTTYVMEQEAIRQQKLQNQRSMVEREIFYKAMPPGIEQGARYVFGKADELAEGTKDAGVPIAREFAAPWFNRAAAIPGESIDTSANVIAKLEQAQADFRKTGDRLHDVRLRAEGVSPEDYPPELQERLKDPSLNELKDVRYFAEDLHRFAGEYLDFVHRAGPQRSVESLGDINNPMTALKWLAGTLGDTSSFMAQVAVGNVVAGGTGAWLAAAIPSVSEVSQEIRERTGGEMHPDLALPMGFAIASMEKMGFEMIGGAFSPVIRKAVRQSITSRIMDTLTRAAGEGFTETGQEELSMQAGWAALTPEEQAKFEQAGLDEERWTRLTNAFAAGFVGGGGISGSGNLISHLTQEEQEEITNIRDSLDPEVMQAIDDLARTSAAAGIELTSQEELQRREQEADAEELRFLEEHPELQDLINQGDPRVLAETFGMSEEEAAKLILRHKVAVEDQTAPAPELDDQVAPPEDLGVETGQPLEETLATVTPEQAAPPQDVEPITARAVQPGDQLYIDGNIVIVASVEPGENRGQRVITFENGEADIVAGNTQYTKVNALTEVVAEPVPEPAPEAPPPDTEGMSREEAKRVEAEAREAARAGRTPQEQLAILDERLGVGQGAAKERARLQAEIDKQPPEAPPTRVISPAEQELAPDQTEKVKAGDLQVGDRVVEGDGVIRTVTGIEPGGQRGQRAITFDDGETDNVSPRAGYTRIAPPTQEAAPDSGLDVGPGQREFQPPAQQEFEAPPTPEATEPEAPAPLTPDEAIERLNGYGLEDAANAAATLRTGGDLTADERAALDAVLQQSRNGEIDENIAPALDAMLAQRLEEAPTVELKADERSVLDAIAAGATTLKDIAAKSGLTPSKVRLAVNVLQEKGQIEKTGVGSVTDPYSFAIPGQEAVVEEEAPEQTTEEKVLDALASGMVDARALAEGVGIPIREARNILNDLVDRGEIEKTGQGSVKAPYQYRLPKGDPRIKASPQKQALEAKGKRYVALLNAANTMEQLNAVAEMWAQETQKPWWIEFEDQIKKKREVIAKLGKPRKGAQEPPKSREELAKERAAKKAAATEEEQEAPKAGPFTEALKGDDRVQSDEGAAPEQEAAPEEEKEEGKKSKKKKRKTPPPPEKRSLSEIERVTLREIKAGQTKTGDIARKTGIPRNLIRNAFHALGSRGLITLEKKLEGEREKLFAAPTVPGQEAEAKKQYAEAKEKAKEKEKAEKKAKKEESPADRVEKEYNENPRPIEKEEKERDRRNEAGVLMFAPQQEFETDEEAARARSKWAENSTRDWLARGKKRITRGVMETFNTMKAALAAGRKESEADFRLIDRVLNRITRNKQQRIRDGKVIHSYLKGEEDMTEERMNKILKGRLNPDDIKMLKERRDENQRRHNFIINSDIIPESVRQKLMQQEFYLRRAYERFVRKKGFLGRQRRYQPRPEDKRDAIELVAAEYGKEVKKIANRLYDTQKEVPEEFDFVEFFSGYETDMLRDMDPELADRLIGLRNQVQQFNRAIDIIDAGTEAQVGIVERTDGLVDMAKEAVEILISDPSVTQQGGHIQIGNLQERFLTDVFRRLYGEITDPAVLQALTTEAQSTLIAQAQFFDTILNEGKGYVWSDSVSSDNGHTVQLGKIDKEGKLREDDVFRYGKLAGKFVSPEFKDFLDRKGLVDASLAEMLDIATLDPTKMGGVLGKGYAKLQGFTRTLALTTPGAYLRNYFSSYLQFAMNSGDFFHSDFQKKFTKNSWLALKVLFNRPDAIRIIAEDMRKGAFRYTQASIVSDLAPVLSGISKAAMSQNSTDMEGIVRGWLKLKSIPKKVKEGYILVDYAAKKAAWETRRDIALKHGLSQELAELHATEHVSKFYQNAEKVPEWINALSRSGLTDFAGFKYDSMRMAVNGAINLFVTTTSAREQSPEGSKLAEWKGVANAHPELLDTWEALAGFSGARFAGVMAGLYGPGQYLFLFGGTGKLLSLGVAAISQLLPGVDDEEVDELEKPLSRAMNWFLPSYDANSVRWEWKATNKDGEKVVRVVPLGNQFGNFGEEAFIGLVQRMTMGGESPSEIAESMVGWDKLPEWFPMGMTMSNLYESVSGYDPQTQSKQPSFTDAIKAATTPKKAEALAQTFLNLMADSTGGFGRAWKKHSEKQRRAGRTPQAGVFLKENGWGETEQGSVADYLDSLSPLTRTLRVNSYDKNSVLLNLPYKFDQDIQAVSEWKTRRGIPGRMALLYKEGATADEIAKGLQAVNGYNDSLKRAAGRYQKIRPLLEYLDIGDEEAISTLLSKKSGIEHSVNRDEMEAVIYNRVDDYIDSREYYKPDPRVSSDRKGDGLMRSIMATQPFMPPAMMREILRKEGYEVGTDDAFERRWKDARRDLIKRRRDGWMVQ